MTVETIPGTDIRYGLISFDAKGQERAEGGALMSAQLVERAVGTGITDVFFFSHGWKGDVPAAKDQYNRWMGALMRSADLGHAPGVLQGFSPLLIGLHWPSLPWGDEELGSRGSFGAGVGPSVNRLLQNYLDILGHEPGIRGPLEVIFGEARRNMAPDSLPAPVREAYKQLNNELDLDSEGVGGAPDADREGFDPDESIGQPQSFGGGGDENLGGILGPLRQLSYWTMKKRARSIGEGGMHSFLVNLQNATAARRTRIHLMGHSFGTVVVSSMVGGPGGRAPLPRPIDSMSLVQGAVSLWSYASAIPFHNVGPGYFNRILTDRKVRGPIAVTTSIYDKAVGTLYPFASRIDGSASFPVGVLPEFGALGSFGMQGTGQASALKMLNTAGRYAFEPGRVYNLESSQFICKGSGASGAHSDIDGPQVAHMIWAAAFASTAAVASNSTVAAG